MSVSGKLSEMHLGQQPLHSCQVTYFQLQVIKEPQRDCRKDCPESPTCCYTVLLGAELQLPSSLQTPGAAHLRRASPRARACLLHLLPGRTAPAPALWSHPVLQPRWLTNMQLKRQSLHTPSTAKQCLTPTTAKACGNPHEAVAFVAFSPYPGDSQHSLGTVSAYSVKNE